MQLSNNSVQRKGADFASVPDLPGLMWSAPAFRRHLRERSGGRADPWHEVLLPRIRRLLARAVVACAPVLKPRAVRGCR